ncbi:MAG: preprotein translocase subunit YajC [Aeriscardovia sp.]|nr:preprotein translocase subunit YajC [Aeriscardovia sp.]MBO6018919.1 preprotein translocase subunit YajC [Aeriscardovia sp.]MBO6071398.1 preprotein translocase subunit YajC [Aeriscardovia sp.]
MRDNYLLIIAMIIIIIVFAIFSMRRSKKTRTTQEEWLKSLRPGDPVATVSGLLGKIREIDIRHDQVVIDSEGSLSRWRIQAIVKPPVIPAYAGEDREEAKAEAEEKKKGSFLAKKSEPAPQAQEKSVEHVEANGAEEGVKVENIDLMNESESSNNENEDGEGKVAKIENQD